MKKNIIIKNASQIVTCSGFSAKSGKEMSDLKVIEQGDVVIENGIITTAGKSNELSSGKTLHDFHIIDASGKAVLPGFVDSHTHFIFGGYRPDEFILRLHGATYMEIMSQGGGIFSTVQATRKASKDELISEGMKRLDTMASFGVTTVEGKSGYGLDRENEIKQLESMTELDRVHPLDVVPTFLGAHAVPETYEGQPDDYLKYLAERVLPEVADRGLAEFCDVFCEEGVFSVLQSRKFLLEAKKLGLKPKIHADEIVQLGGAELAAEVDAISADHLLYASDKGIQALAKSGTVATLLPGTAFGLKQPYARARYMIDHNCAVALATDLNPGSCFSESIPLIFALSTLYMDLSIEEAITALTINGAAAIGRAKNIGSIDVGKKGDLLILEYPSYNYIPYHIGVSTVEKVIKDGKLIFDKGETSPVLNAS